MTGLPPRVRVVEVGPRDGLQAEPVVLDTASKVALIDRLSGTGLSVIEAVAFVSPERVPQLADAEAVWSGIRHAVGVVYPALVANPRGLERALAAGVRQVALAAAASDTFCQKNLRCSLDESLRRYAELLRRAHAAGVAVRAYVSCALGCPYEGEIPAARVAGLARRFVDAGCFEVALGDTIGAGTPLAARALVRAVAELVPVERIALHFHDTRGQALANVFACLEEGVAVVDGAVAGLGGCPFAPGASGNLATEDLVFMLHGMGIATGVDLDRLVEAGRFASRLLERPNRSRVGAVAPSGKD